jgi:dihydroxyacid dehydratase/phosphogluconate dehydratase
LHTTSTSTIAHYGKSSLRYAADAMITLGGCDKSVPGALQPIARLDIPGITLFGGPALPGKCTDHITLTDRGLDPGKASD